LTCFLVTTDGFFLRVAWALTTTLLVTPILSTGTDNDDEGPAFGSLSKAMLGSAGKPDAEDEGSSEE
jgi:hypothetical protein